MVQWAMIIVMTRRLARHHNAARAHTDRPIERLNSLFTRL
jgi:hypothetical protein